MEKEHCILDTIFDDSDDVEMVDVEEGELLEDAGEDSLQVETKNCPDDTKSRNMNDLRGWKKKKKKRKRKSGGGGSAAKVPDVNRFVIDTCRKLKEKKSYMVYSAVACLGISALSNLLQEVDVVQSCGGQMTTDGRRFRTGGGVLWNILKIREPAAYKEIMKRTKDFEKQFKQQNRIQVCDKSHVPSPSEPSCTVTNDPLPEMADYSEKMLQIGNDQDNSQVNRTSVHDRLRIPVSYSDLLSNDTNNDSLP